MDGLRRQLVRSHMMAAPRILDLTGPSSLRSSIVPESRIDPGSTRRCSVGGRVSCRTDRRGPGRRPRSPAPQSSEANRAISLDWGAFLRSGFRQLDGRVGRNIGQQVVLAQQGLELGLVEADVSPPCDPGSGGPDTRGRRVGHGRNLQGRRGPRRRWSSGL